MIVTVAWRNIWRSPLRSIIVLLSIVLGIWAGVFISAFSYGLNNQRVADALNSNFSHLQIHSAEFEKEERTGATLQNPEALYALLDKTPGVVAYAKRAVINGMIASPATARGARVLAVEPEEERAVSSMPEKMIEGGWFEEEKRNPIVLGKRLAEILNVEVGSKVVLTFQDEEFNLISVSFRVTGLYKSYNSKLDELLIYVRQSDIAAQTGSDLLHEVAVITESYQDAEWYAGKIRSALPSFHVKTWRDLSPELGYSDDMMTFSLVLVMSIIMLALMFGIINNMLMAVLERKHELGMLQAIGMNKIRIFSMIVIETLFIGLVGGPAGMLLGWITVLQLGKSGINLQMFGAGLESFGIATRVFPQLEPQFYLIIGGMVVAMALLASLFPARQALKLNPVEAIRSI